MTSARDQARRVFGAVGVAVADTLGVAALRGAEHVAGSIRAEAMGRVKGSPTTVLTGALARSWRSRFVTRGATEATAEAYSELAYARIQDEGGTIKPRTRKFLAIPLVRLPVGKWPRDWPRDALQFIRTRRGGLLVERVKRGRGRAIYALVRSSTIKGSGYVAAGIKAAEPDLADIVGATLRTRLARLQ